MEVSERVIPFDETCQMSKECRVETATNGKKVRQHEFIDELIRSHNFFNIHHHFDMVKPIEVVLGWSS